MKLATGYRRLLRSVVFVGVTGSGGKTTTTALVAAVLRARSEPMNPPPLLHNNLQGVARRILRTRPTDRFSAVEVAAWEPGSVARSSRLLEPRVGIVTNIGTDHRTAFRTLDATAAEKEALIAALPPDGVAVLNADDPRVNAMKSSCRGRVISYGLAPEATVSGHGVRAVWPERLSLEVAHGGESVRVETRLCGSQWASSVLASLATGVALGFSLWEGAQAIGGVEPSVGRMSPVELEDGVTFIRDDWKAPWWSLPLTLAFLREARANRKILVLGTISDYPGASSPKYRDLARGALDVADHVVFVGNNAHLARRAADHPRGDVLRTYATVEQASPYVHELLQPGDLVVLKGSDRADHLVRILSSRWSVPGAASFE